MPGSRGGLCALVFAALAGACATSNEVRCADGRLCPPGTTCDDPNQRCLSPGQVLACDGLVDGDPCMVSGAPGACRGGACEPLVCGDGVRTLGEACDGTDLGGATCETAGFYEPAGLVCSPFCTFDVSACVGRCGDGMVNGSELCDMAPPPGACESYGFDAGPLACGASCGVAFDACARFGWIPEPTGLPTAYVLAASGADDIWVAGETPTERRVAHYDGVSWSTEFVDADTSLSAIDVAGPGDVWVASIATTLQPAALLHRVNAQWVPAGAPAAEYQDVWAASPNAVFVATADAGVLRWDGSAWDTLGALTGSIVQIDGTDISDVWAVRGDGTLARWNGSAWLPITVDVQVSRVVPLAIDDVWVVGSSLSFPGQAAAAHWDGMQWTVHVEPTVSTWLAATALGANDLWVSTNGSTRHYDGVQWSTHEQTALSDSYPFGQLRHFGDEIIGLSSDGYLYRYRHQAYARFNFGLVGPNSSPSLAGVLALSPYETIAIDSRRTAYHFNGTSWTPRVVDPNTGEMLTAIGGSAADDVWAGMSGGRIYHFDGASWAFIGSTSLSTPIRKVLAFAPDNVWFVGQTAIVRFNGTSLENMVTGNPAFAHGGGSGPDDVWAAAVDGGSTSFWHYDGTGWSTTAVPSAPYVVTAFHVLARDRAYAVVGSTNLVITFDGTGWSTVTLPAASPLVSIYAVAIDDVFAISQTELFHFDGAGWSRIRAPLDTAVATRRFVDVVATPSHVDLIYAGNVHPALIRRLVRTRPWNCKATETACSDGVDNDCDGTHDALDTDCP